MSTCCNRRNKEGVKIKTITFFYNESFLIPFYLSHYSYADQIHAVVSTSTDNTEALLRAAPNVHVHNHDFPGGKLNDGLKRDLTNEILSHLDTSQHDWVIICDSDEFIWFGRDPEGDPRKILANVKSNETFLVARLWNVFRHRTDADLDPSIKPVVYQRRHGIEARDPHYQKPCVIRSSAGIRIEVGAHTLLPTGTRVKSGFDCDGSHWQNADPCFCINRRVRDRALRLSDENHAANWGHGVYGLVDATVRDYCESHLDDPRLF